MNAPNSNVVDVSCSFTEQGLLEITFKCKGVPEFPTSLNLAYKDSFRDAAPRSAPYDIYGDLRKTFRGGVKTTQLMPRYSYEGTQAFWYCSSLCLQDGSPYFSDCRPLPKTKYPHGINQKYRIFDSSYSLSEALPLVYVSFTGVGNKPIYPTALNSKFSANDKITDAFWGGSESTQLQCSWSRNDERVGNIWKATTVLHLDNTPYFPNVVRDLNATDKLRIFDASYKIDDENSLLYVTFKGVGTVNSKGIYPSALITGKTLEDNIVDAFFGGDESVHLGTTWQRYDERIGWIWETTTVLNLDGSAIDSTSVTTLREYTDIAEVPIAGKIDITWDTGQEMTPPITHKIRAKVTIKLIPESLLTTANLAIPYYVESWAQFGAAGSLEDGRIVSEQGGASGYLIGEAEGSDVGTEGHTYRGAKCGSVFDVWGESTPSHSAYLSSIYTSLLDSDMSILFSSVAGKRYYILKEVRGLGKDD